MMSDQKDPFLYGFYLDAQNEKNKSAIRTNDYTLPISIEHSYLKVGDKFFDKKDKELRFQDSGDKLLTSSQDKVVIQGMVEIAKAKNWESIELSGTTEFKQKAWLEAETAGLKTSGYKPKEADLVELEALRKERSLDTIKPSNSHLKLLKPEPKTLTENDQVRLTVARKVLEESVKDLSSHDQEKILASFDEKVEVLKATPEDIKDIFPDPQVKDLHLEPMVSVSERSR
jgi:hypothetical protein